MLEKRTEKTLLAAMTLNNRGVAFLKKQQYKRAILYFSKGLKLSQQKLESADPHSSEMTLDKCMSSRDYPVDIILPGLSKSAFLRPIIVSVLLSSPSEYNQILPFILIFNQAIAHHLLGSERRSKRFIQKAIKLYECSLCGVSRHNRGGTSTVYVCACLNNMASLYRLLKQPKDSERCLHHLLSTLMLLTNDTHGWPQSLNIFFASAATLMGSRIAAPAA
jgi:tetratricopeptide (TPR) repeat protein